MTAMVSPVHDTRISKRELQEEVALIDKEDAHGRVRLTPHKLRLLFPSHWRSPYRDGNIYVDAFERCTINWFDRFGLIKNENDRETVRKFSCGRYGGYAFPRATFRDGLLITEFVSWWLLWDDRVVENGTGWGIDEVVLAMKEDAALSGSDCFTNAWNDLCTRLRQTQSLAWMTRTAAEMEVWMRNAKRETSIAKEYKKSGILPSFDEWLAIRLVSVGMYPTFYLLEMTEGFELPESFHEHDVVREMKRLASRLVGLGNDLGGLAKDLADGWPNPVTVLQQERSLSIYDAFCYLVDMHNAEVEAFDQLEQQLPSWGVENDLRIRGWVQAVRYSIVGFTLWESRAERYQDRKILVNDKILSALVVFLDTHTDHANESFDFQGRRCEPERC